MRTALVEDNDVFNVLNESDRDYTQGGVLAITLPEAALPRSARDALRALPISGSATSVHAGVFVGQTIYTPEDIENPALIESDRPYAGWLHGGLAVQVIRTDPDASRRDDRSELLLLDIGAVGPASGAHHAQDQVHVLIKSDRPRGWEHQLQNETAGHLQWEGRRRLLYRRFDEGPEWDFLTRATVRAGNSHTDAGGGFLARLGWNLPRDFGPAAIDGTDLDGDPAPRRWSAHFFCGASGRAVAYSIFLDGNSDGRSHSVTRRPVVAETEFGVAVGWGPISLSYAQHVRSPEFNERRRFHRFASVLLAVTLRF